MLQWYFLAYIGFDAVSTAAEETKDRTKNLPKGIIGSLIISSILYIVVAAVLTGMVPYYLLNTLVLRLHSHYNMLVPIGLLL